MIRKSLLASFALAMIFAGTPAVAHHSANAQFDTKQDLIITGIVTKVENINPHSWWYVDVKGPDGKVTPWRLESLSPNGLIRQGLKVRSDMTHGLTEVANQAVPFPRTVTIAMPVKTSTTISR